MQYKLLLNESSYPKNFLKIEVNPPDGMEKEKYVEEKILHAINTRNPKFALNEVEYIDIHNQFSNFQSSNYAGMIVEEYEINEAMKKRYAGNEYYCFLKEGKWYARRPWVYLFLSVPKEGGRNVFVSQSIFPALIDYMDLFLNSSSYTIANHPLYFINIVNKSITAPSIVHDLAGIIAMNVVYIDVFGTTIDYEQVPHKLDEFIEKYNKDYVPGASEYSTECYEIDFASRKLKIKTTDLVVGSYLVLKESSCLDFNGSDEKFYWMDLIPVVFLALANDYSIDYSQLEEFCNKNSDMFAENNKKFRRFKSLLRYIKKCCLR